MPEGEESSGRKTESQKKATKNILSVFWILDKKFPELDLVEIIKEWVDQNIFTPEKFLETQIGTHIDNKLSDDWEGLPDNAKIDLKWNVCNVIETIAPELCFLCHTTCGKHKRELTQEKINEKEKPLEPVDITKFVEDKAFKPRLLTEHILNKFNFITPRDTEEVYIYNGGSYRRQGETFIKEFVNTILGEDTMTRAMTEVVNLITASTYIERGEMDKEKSLLNLKNGILDINTMEFRNHTPEIISTVQMPVKYNPDADCPKINQFLKEVVNEDDILVVQEMIGYCLLKDYPIAKAFMLLGSGANGKSTVLNLIERLIGEKNTATPSLQDIINNRFAQAELFGKLANIHGDIPHTKLKHTGRFKMLTGRDIIRGERKHRDSFDFRNYAKLIYSANELPETKDLTRAFFRRWVIIDFPNIFTEDDTNTDTNILNKITTEEELSGLLNWALEGLNRVLTNQKFTTSKSQEEVEKRWVKQTDSLRAFVDEKIKGDPGEIIIKDDFFNLYRNYCAENELTPVEDNMIGRRLPTLHSGVKKSKITIMGKRTPVWKGIYFDGEEAPEGEGPDSQMKIQDMINESEDEQPKKGKITQKDLVREILKYLKECEKSRMKTIKRGAMTARFIKEFNVDESRIIEMIERLKTQGDIFEPKEGELKLA